uniref:Ig-like domain-containing protein n=1 Tax=Neogobius melanostomus TaxID=47308 RepID=A0A8C6WT13_9GOBI
MHNAPQRFTEGQVQHNETLTQPDSVTVQSGDSLSISCTVSYSVSSYWTAWIRQHGGKALEWIGHRSTGPSYFKKSLKSKFSISVDSSSNTVTLIGRNMQPGDSGVYFCAREPQSDRAVQKHLSVSQNMF